MVLSAQSAGRHAIDGWIEAAVASQQPLEVVWEEEEWLAAGYELTRARQVNLPERSGEMLREASAARSPL